MSDAKTLGKKRVTYTLKNRPKCEDTTDVRCMECYQWFVGFTKQLRKMRRDYKKHGIGDPVVDMLFKDILGES